MRATKRNKQLARKLYRLCLVDGLLDDARARDVVRRIIQSRRRGHLGVLLHFQRLVRLDLDRHTAHVESAVPLADDLRAGVGRSLIRMFGSGVEALFSENAALIGGMRVKVGSDVYDGSVQGRLASIVARL